MYEFMNNKIKRFVILGNITILVFYTSVAFATSIDQYILMLKSKDPQKQIEAAKELRITADPNLTKAVEPLIALLMTTENGDVKQAVIQALEIGDERAIKPLLNLLDSADKKAALQTLIYIINSRRNYPKIIPYLIPLLEIKNPELRNDAIRALSNFGELAIPEIQKLISSESVLLRQDAASILGNIDSPEALTLLIRLIEDDNIEVRKAAVGAIGRYQNISRDKESLEALISLFKSEFSGVKITAIEVFAKLEYKSGFNQIIATLKDKDVDVRRTAAEVLGDKRRYKLYRFKSRYIENLPLIIAAAGDEDWQVRRDIVSILGDINDERSTECLQYLLRNDSSPKVRKEAINSMGKLGSKTSIPTLIEAMNDSDKNIRNSAIRALGKIKSESAVTFLISILDDPILRRDAIISLGKQKNKLAVEPLLKLLPEEDKNLGTVIRALGEINDEECILPLLNILDSSDDKIRKAVVRALGKFDDRRITLAMINLLLDKDTKIKKAAASILKKSKYKDNEVILKLRDVLDCDDIDARKHVSQVLRRFTGLTYTHEKKLTESIKENDYKINEILDAVEKGDWPAKKEAFNRFYKINNFNVIKRLLPYLKDKDTRLRDLAISFITSQIQRMKYPFYGTVEEIEVLDVVSKELIKSLSDRKLGKFSKERAIRALGTMQVESAIDPLLDIVKGRGHKKDLRVKAVGSLGKIGSSKAVPVLVEQVKHSDERLIRIVSLESLADIGGDESIRTIKNALDDESKVIRQTARAVWYRAMEKTLPPDKFEKLKAEMDVQLETAKELSQSSEEMLADGDFSAALKNIKETISLYEQIADNYPNKYAASKSAIGRLRLLRVGCFKKANDWKKVISGYDKIITSESQQDIIPFYLFYIAKIYETKLKDYSKAAEYYQDVIKQIEVQKQKPELSIFYSWLNKSSQFGLNNIMQNYPQKADYSPKSIKIKFPCLEFDALYSPLSMYGYAFLISMGIDESIFMGEGLINERLIKRNIENYEAKVMYLFYILQLELMLYEEDTGDFMEYRYYVDFKNKFEKGCKNFINLYPEDLDSIIIRLKLIKFYDESGNKKMAKMFSEEVKAISSQKNIILTIGPDKRFLTPEDTWDTYKSALLKGDVDSALECFTVDAQPRYRKVFEILGRKEMKKIARDMQQIHQRHIGKDGAKYVILRKEKGQEISYFITFYKIYDEWKIESL